VELIFLNTTLLKHYGWGLINLHNSTFNERIMMATIQEDENSNTRRSRVMESSE
jgi:hypothetical protein